MKLTQIHPKLPMRDKETTKDFYLNQLNFSVIGTVDYEGYLMIKRDEIEIHFFEFKDLNPLENYGQVYIRTENIQELYQNFLEEKVSIHPNGKLEVKSWGTWEFSILDPDSNLLTFGQSVV